MGGGTGGHVVPGLHVLDHLLEGGVELTDLLWFGAGRPVEDRVFAGLEERLGERPFERVVLALEPPGGGAPSRLRVARRTWPEMRRARRALRAHGSQVLFALGGYTSLPAVLAARSLGIPVVLLEVNAVQGKATRWTSILAKRVMHAWPASMPERPRKRHVFSGPPLAPVFSSGRPDEAAGAAAREAMGFRPDLPLLLALGGSQGALPINDFLRTFAPRIVGSGVQVLHQVGPGREREACAPFSGYRSREYLEDVPTALAGATAVLCRGGASTLAEVAARGCPAVVVPYPHHADQHQAANARCLGEGVRIVDEGRLGGGFVDELIALASPAQVAERTAMTAALLEALPRDGGRRVSQELLTLAK